MLCGTCVWAQNDTGAPDNGAPTQPGPKPAYTYPDTTPSLDFLSSSVENSSITLGIGAGFSFDSNAYSYSSGSRNSGSITLRPASRFSSSAPNSRGTCRTPLVTSSTNIRSTWTVKQHSVLAARGRGVPVADESALAAHRRQSLYLLRQPIRQLPDNAGDAHDEQPQPIAYYPLTQT